MPLRGSKRNRKTNYRTFTSWNDCGIKEAGEGGLKEKARLCIDFRELNKLLIQESQPFPLIEDIIVRVKDCKWFTSIDLNSAFWSIPIRVKDRYKTGFVTQNGH